MKLSILSILLTIGLFSTGCKTWSALKSDTSETLDKAKEQTKEVVEGTQRASKKAVNKMQDAFGTEEE